MAEGPLGIALRVVAILDELEIPYVLDGSLASSLIGEPRATADVDLAIRISDEQLSPLLLALDPDFYVSEDAARDAVRRHTSFNLVHLDSVLKVDLFVLGDDLLDRRQLERRQRVQVRDDPPCELWIGSEEDQILRKLTWYEAGGQVSDRQWRDVLGILAVQQSRLDMESLRSQAQTLGLSELLERAIGEVERE